MYLARLGLVCLLPPHRVQPTLVARAAGYYALKYILHSNCATFLHSQSLLHSSIYRLRCLAFSCGPPQKRTPPFYKYTTVLSLHLVRSISFLLPTEFADCYSVFPRPITKNELCQFSLLQVRNALPLPSAGCNHHQQARGFKPQPMRSSLSFALQLTEYCV